MEISSHRNPRWSLVVVAIGLVAAGACLARVEPPTAGPPHVTTEAAQTTVARATTPDTPRDADGNPIPLQNQERRATMGQDSPDEAMRWVMLAQRDEFGRVAPNGLMIAREQMNQLRARQSGSGRGRGQAAPRATAAGATIMGTSASGAIAIAGATTAAAGTTAAAAGGISPMTWTWIGPGNIGGRTRAIAIHPTSPSIIFAGSVAGGIWRSTDAGASWAVVNDFMANLAVTSIVFQPGNPSVMLAATGEGFFNQDAIKGAGIFMSADTGTTWTQLASTAPTSSFQDFTYVNRLAFSADGATLLAVTNTGLYRSTNLGTSWTKTLAVSLMADVKFLAGSSANAVASSRARQAYYSTNAGVSWTLASGLNGGCSGSTGCRVELGVSQSSPATVYASLEVSGGNSQVWKSTNGGVSYAQTDTGATSSKLGTQGWYDNVVWVDPTNDGHLIVGGVSLWRSTDAGVTFASLNGIHSDHHAIVADPGFNGTTNRLVYFGGDGGLYKSANVAPGVTITFTMLNNNYGVTQFYGGSSVTNGKIFGGTQDNGSLLYTPANGAQAWTAMAGGDGGFAAGDPTDPNYMYGEFQWMQVHRSSNGSTSSSIAGCTKSAPYKLVDGCASSSSSTNFIAPILLDPNNANRLLAGGANLWRTSDARTANTTTTGPSWANIKSTVSSNISAIAVALGDSDTIWVGHNNGNLYATSNGTAASPTWVQKDAPASGAQLPNRVITSIAIDPANKNIVYVSMGGFSSGNVWKTADGGSSWSDATGAVGTRLPDAPVRSVVAHPTQPGWIYAGTDVGVFASQDGGATWSVPQDGPSNVAVFQLFFTGTRLVAVTHGRGMFVADTVAANPPVDVNVVQNGDFSGGITGWQLYEPPDIVNNGAANGVFQYHRASPMTSASQQAVVFQNTGQPVAAGSPLLAQFDIGNADTVRKRISVLMLDSDFSDLSVCTFWLPASSALHTYQMRTHPTKNWANASIYFYTASDGTGDYLLDNVTIKYEPALASDRTECVDPLAPGAPGGSAGPNLLVNGDFGTGALAPWTTFGAITTQIVTGVFEFYRPTAPAGTPAGVVLQSTGQSMSAGEILTATFQLGNDSTARKRVTVLMHDLDFSDLSACTFWLAPGQTLATYTMRTYATKAWTNATLSVYAATIGPEAWIRLDNAVLQRTPGTAPLGTECLEPTIGPQVATVQSATVLAAASGVSAPASTASGGERTAGARARNRSVAAVAGALLGGTSAVWPDSIDLRDAAGAQLTFASMSIGGLSLGSVQVSLDGAAWQTVAVTPATGDWASVAVALDAFVGHVVYLRFAHDSFVLSLDAAPAWWLIGDVTIDIRRERR